MTSEIRPPVTTAVNEARRFLQEFGLTWPWNDPAVEAEGALKGPA